MQTRIWRRRLSRPRRTCTCFAHSRDSSCPRASFSLLIDVARCDLRSKSTTAAWVATSRVRLLRLLSRRRAHQSVRTGRRRRSRARAVEAVLARSNDGDNRIVSSEKLLLQARRAKRQSSSRSTTRNQGRCLCRPLRRARQGRSHRLLLYILASFSRDDEQTDLATLLSEQGHDQQRAPSIADACGRCARHETCVDPGMAFMRARLFWAIVISVKLLVSLYDNQARDVAHARRRAATHRTVR